MQANVKLLAELATSGLTGSVLWMIYGAFWKHAPVKFPRSIDEWWTWIRGTNQEIASQHNPNGSNIPPNPIYAGGPGEGRQITMSLLDTLKNAEHTFAAWVAKTYAAFRKEEPTIIAVSDRVYPYVKSAVQIAIGFESPEVAALAGPVIDKIHAGLDTAAGLVYDFGPTPTAAGVLATVQSDLASLETVAGIKSDGAKNAISKALNSLGALVAAITGAIAGAKSDQPVPVPVANVPVPVTQ